MLVIFILAYIYYMAMHGKRQTALKESNMYKRLQLLSSAAFSLGHGGADSQKVMGIICAALLVYGNLDREGKLEDPIPSQFKISEVIQVSYKNEDGKTMKFKPDELTVYSKGENIYDASTDEITHRSIALLFTVLATVFPTLISNTQKAKTLNPAAQTTAWKGVKTLVETTVAIEFAASWKPLTKSNNSAITITAINNVNIITIYFMRIWQIFIQLH